MLDKIFGLTLFLDFIDRCPFTSCPSSAIGSGQNVQPLGNPLKAVRYRFCQKPKPFDRHRKCAGGVYRGGAFCARERIAQPLPYTAFFGYFLGGQESTAAGRHPGAILCLGKRADVGIRP